MYLSDPLFDIVNAVGAPISGAKARFYLTGTTNNATTYSDAALTTPNTNPVIADSAGRFPPIYLDPDVTYRLQVLDASNVLIVDRDPISENDLNAAHLEYDPPFAGAITNGYTIAEKLAQTISVEDFGAVGNGTTDDTIAIQAAIDYAESINGGIVMLPQGTYKITATLNMNASVGVQLIGQGSDGIHDGGTGAAAATTISWYGSAGGTMLNVASPSGAGNARQFGPSVQDIKFDCRSLAGIGLLVNSVRNGTFSRLYILSPRTAGVKTTTLGNANLAEASDTQRCVFDRISVRSIDDADTKPAHGLWLTSHSPVGSNSNTSLNVFTQCDMQMWGGSGSGYGLFLEDGDNNTFNNLRVTRAGGTTVESVRIVGNTFCDANHFWNLSAGGANSIVIKGTASGFAKNPTKNSFWVTDVENGTQYPTFDNGVQFVWHADDGQFVKLPILQLALADGSVSAITQRAALNLETLRIANGSDSHVIVTDGTNVWNISIEGINGNLRFVRLAGTGSVDLGSLIQAFGGAVSVGAADSGGVGYKLLRIPN